MKLIGQYILEKNLVYLFDDMQKNKIFRFKKYFKIEEKSETKFYLSLNKIFCKCEKKSAFKINHVTKTPSVNVFNHLDLFSCHKNEFDALFKQKFLPRENGILWDNLHFTIHSNNIPLCCDRFYRSYDTGNVLKIFINEINFYKSNREIIQTIFYYLLKNIFKSAKEIKIGSLKLKKLNETHCLIFRDNKNSIFPALQLSFEIVNETYEIENINGNRDIYNFLKEILLKNKISTKTSFLVNLF